MIGESMLNQVSNYQYPQMQYQSIQAKNFQSPQQTKEAFIGETQILQNLYLNYANSNRYACINGQWMPINPNTPQDTIQAVKNRLAELNAVPEIPKTN